MHKSMKFEIGDDCENGGEAIFKLKFSKGKYIFYLCELNVNIYEKDRINVAKQFRLMADFLEDD